MALWHRSPAVAYLAVFMGVLGHGSSEAVAVASGLSGPEISVLRFLLGPDVRPLQWLAIAIICSAVAVAATWPERGGRVTAG